MLMAPFTRSLIRLSSSSNHRTSNMPREALLQMPRNCDECRISDIQRKEGEFRPRMTRLTPLASYTRPGCGLHHRGIVRRPWLSALFGLYTHCHAQHR